MKIIKDIINKENEYRIESDNLIADVDYILSEGIDNVGINMHSNYLIKDIDYIGTKLGGIKKFHIGCRNIDLKGLLNLEKLEYLTFLDGNYNIDLSNLTNLRHLGFRYDKNIKGLANLTNLNILTVSNSNVKFNNIIPSYKKLVNLDIRSCKNCSIDSFITKDSNLEVLKVHQFKQEVNLHDLLPIKHKLKELRFSSCKKIVGHEYIKELKNLEILVFSDCNPIENSNIIDGLERLKQLSITGSTFFKDGDISNLQKEGLTIGITNKRHYNLKSNQFINYFRNPHKMMP